MGGIKAGLVADVSGLVTVFSSTFIPSPESLLLGRGGGFSDGRLSGEADFSGVLARRSEGLVNIGPGLSTVFDDDALSTGFDDEVDFSDSLLTIEPAFSAVGLEADDTSVVLSDLVLSLLANRLLLLLLLNSSF